MSLNVEVLVATISTITFTSMGYRNAALDAPYISKGMFPFKGSWEIHSALSVPLYLINSGQCLVMDKIF